MKKTSGKVIIYPAPADAALSDQYVVKVNGRPVDVYGAPVWEPSYGKPFGGPYSFAYFDFSGSVTVQVESRKQPLLRDRLRILPESQGIRPVMEGSNLSFTVTSPCRLSIEPDAKNSPLLLFANPMEVNPPKPGDPGVIYFGPGIHKPDEIKVADNQTLYIAGGAVVKGGIRAQGANISIRGRGIVEGLDWAWLKGPTDDLLRLTSCTNARVEGVILKDSWSWCFPMYGCRGVRVSNVKIVSARCENNDGIGVCNSRDVKIEDCFIRSDDDCITTKGFGEQLGIDPYPPVEDVTVERCALWTDRAHVWRLGCESRAEGMRRLVFRDIDVLHYRHDLWAIIVQPAEGMLMEDVRFENIRIHGEGQPLFIEITTAPTMWAKQQTPGRVRNIVFKDLVLGGMAGDGLIAVAGSDPDHTVAGITFEKVMRYGTHVTQASPHVRIGEHTKEIDFKP